MDSVAGGTENTRTNRWMALQDIMRPDIIWILKHKIIHRDKSGAWNPAFEPEVKKLIGSLSGDVFVDIGCNLGFYSQLARKRFRQVYSIDPNPKYQASIQVAISNKYGHQPFYLGNGIGSADSLIKNPHILGEDWKNEDNQIIVGTMTFDQLELDADLVKIDVEGAEFEVIEGMNLHLPKAAIIEIHDERRIYEMVLKMEEKGYHWTRIDSYHWFFQK